MIYLGPATCLPYDCFCEALRPEGLMQPINAYSSLALVFVGLIILWIGRRKWFGFLMASSAIIVGIGSFYYHAHLTLGSQAIDNLGMYLVVLVPIMLLLQRRFSLSNFYTSIFFLSGIGVSVWIALVYQGARRYELVIFILVMLAMDFLWGRGVGMQKRTDLYWALGIFFVSFIIWSLDVTKLVCAPQGLLQGHAIWHALNAIAVYFLYRHYERIA